jgi:hypothetical protein
MITSRAITELDRADIKASLERDEFHRGTKADAFFQKGSVTNVYNDENGPILYLRASRSLRIDMMFFNNTDRSRNKDAMVAGFQKLVDSARAAGFAEITTSSNSPALVEFGCRVFGFERVQTDANGEVALRRLL